MPIQCRLVDRDELRQRGEQPKPGDMWFAPWLIEDGMKPGFLSPEYLRDWYGKRPPLVVILPNGEEWLVDSRFHATGERGWAVTGEAPNITATPSINDMGNNPYHGWLQNGILSDDIEGRTYERGDVR